MDDADRATLTNERAMGAWQRRAHRHMHMEPIRSNACCRVCGDSIDPHRMNIFPHAVRCMECQMDWERRS